MSRRIIFQKCNLNYIYFLLYTISYIITQFIDHYLEKNEDSIKNDESTGTHSYVMSFEILNLYIGNISNFFAIIPYFIRKKLLRKKNDNKNISKEISENSGNKEQLELIYNDASEFEKEKRKKINIFYIILIAVFDFLKDFSLVSYFIFFPGHDFYYIPFNCYVIFDILCQFVFSYLILKIHFYKLQYCSLYLNVAIFFLILTFDLLDIFLFRIIEGRMFIIYPFHVIFYCLTYVYGKKVILFGYASIYLIIILKGAIKILLNILFSLIIFLVKRNIFSTLRVYFKKPLKILLMISKIIACFFSDLFFWLIIDRFSPNYTPLILLAEEICNFVEDLIVDKIFVTMPWYKYLRIFLFIISFIGVIIHNEIVVVNICGLGSDTKYFLEHILKEEVEFSQSNNLNILGRYETCIELNCQTSDKEIKEGDTSIES